MTAPAPALSGSGDRNPALERLDRLREGVRGIGRAAARPSLERPMLIAGGLLLPLGLVIIVLGWYGAAHTPRLFEQIPYAISGGFLGGALVVAGGFLYFGYWLTQLVYDGRRQTDQLATALGRLESQMGVLASSISDLTREGSAGGAGAGATTSAVAVAPGALVATASGTMVHRADCAVVANKKGLREVSADAEGFKPCKICEPFG